MGQDKYFNNAVSVFMGACFGRADNAAAAKQVYGKYQAEELETKHKENTYVKAARDLGKLLAQDKAKYNFVWGGSATGLMDVIAKTFHQFKTESQKMLGISIKKYSKLKGSIADFWEDHQDRFERIRRMLEAKINIIAPGGTGSYEEAAAAIEQMRYDKDQTRVIGFLNIKGLYDGIKAYLDKANEEGFLRPGLVDRVIFDSDPRSLIEKIKNKKIELAKQNQSAKS